MRFVVLDLYKANLFFFFFFFFFFAFSVVEEGKERAGYSLITKLMGSCWEVAREVKWRDKLGLSSSVQRRICKRR